MLLQKKKDQSQPGTPGGEPKDDFFWTSANDLPWNSDSNRILEAIIRVASNFPLDNPISDYFCSKTNPHLGTVFQITCKSYKDPTCVFQIPDILYQIIHEGWDPSLIQTLMVAGAQLPTQYMKLMEIIDSSLRNQFFNLFQICLSKLEEVPYSLLSKVITITGNLDLVQQLVEMGAEINTPENAEAFLGLIQHKEEVSPILEYLLKKGFDPNQLQEGRLLSVALEKHNSHMVRLLLEHGADPNASNKILSFAVCNKLSIIKLLVQHGINLHQRISERWKRHYSSNCLHAAARAGNLEMFNYFLEMGVSTEEKDSSNLTPIQTATLPIRQYLEFQKLQKKYFEFRCVCGLPIDVIKKIISDVMHLTIPFFHLGPSTACRLEWINVIQEVTWRDSLHNLLYSTSRLNTIDPSDPEKYLNEYLIQLNPSTTQKQKIKIILRCRQYVEDDLKFFELSWIPQPPPDPSDEPLVTIVGISDHKPGHHSSHHGTEYSIQGWEEFIELCNVLQLINPQQQIDLFMTIYYLSIDFDHSSSSKLYQKQNDFIHPWVLKCLDMTSEDYWVQAEHWSSTIERWKKSIEGGKVRFSNDPQPTQQEEEEERPKFILLK